MRAGLNPIVIWLGLLGVRIGVTCISAARQHVHETHFILRRLFFVQPSVDPFHCISVGTHRIWARRVGVIGHAGKLVMPWRTTRIFPSLPTSMIVAPLPIASGAADTALFIISSSVILPEGIVCC